jgi:hypothetical protein
MGHPFYSVSFVSFSLEVRHELYDRMGLDRDAQQNWAATRCQPVNTCIDHPLSYNRRQCRKMKDWFSIRN